MRTPAPAAPRSRTEGGNQRPTGSARCAEPRTLSPTSARLVSRTAKPRLNGWSASSRLTQTAAAGQAEAAVDEREPDRRSERMLDALGLRHEPREQRAPVHGQDRIDYVQQAGRGDGPGEDERGAGTGPPPVEREQRPAEADE